MATLISFSSNMPRGISRHAERPFLLRLHSSLALDAIRFAFILACIRVVAPFAGSAARELPPIHVEVRVLNAVTGAPIPSALVVMQRDSLKFASITDAEGLAAFQQLAAGSYLLSVSHLGFDPFSTLIPFVASRSVTVPLRASSIDIQEVVVTAKEGRSSTSSSLIGQEALRHLQPSSLADVMELLPGGFSKDPNLSYAQPLSIRESDIPAANLPQLWAKVSKKNYTTSSLGTQVVIDGVPVNTHASLQNIQGLWRPQQYKHVFLNRGVDARALGTDNVDHIEIIRGIPSAEYSNLTSGLIKIHRKTSYRNLESRFKADMQSLSCYVGKGFVMQDSSLSLIVSADYLNAFADPRNVRERFQRASGSLRVYKQWNPAVGTVRLNSALDYSGTFDNSKDDPDINLGNRDIFISERQHIQLSHGMDIQFNKNRLALYSLEYTLSADAQREIMFIDRYVSIGLTTPILAAVTPGERYVGFYPTCYNARQTVEGLPFYSYAKIALEHRFSAPSRLAHSVRYGGNARYAKNYGRGDIFDVALPVFPGNGTRPHAFRSVPGECVFSLFAEDNLSLSAGHFNAELSAGVSGNTLAFLPNGYSMRKKWVFDPRVNALVGYSFLNNHRYGPLSVEISGGAGWLSLFPTIDQLFPEKEYIDIVELNYWHERKEYRTAYVRTYVQTVDASQLMPARNFKWEVRFGSSWNGYSLSVTYFKETMDNGFRTSNEFRPLPFRRYRAESIAHSSLTAPPRVESIPYDAGYLAYMHPLPSNGSSTRKTGVEWVIATKRFPITKIRLTFDGAWFRTQHRNSIPQYAVPGVSIMGQQYPYVGYYEDVEGATQESLNTTLRADAYIPKLDLSVSLALQTNWYGKSWYLPRDEWPIKYVDYHGVWKDFHPADRTDSELRWLQRPMDSFENRVYTVPMMASINLKATKWLFRKRLQIALFVNKIFDYTPDYKENNVTVRRYQNPYFGMEANLKL